MSKPECLGDYNCGEIRELCKYRDECRTLAQKRTMDGIQDAIAKFWEKTMKEMEATRCKNAKNAARLRTK